MSKSINVIAFFRLIEYRILSTSFLGQKRPVVNVLENRYKPLLRDRLQAIKHDIKLLAIGAALILSIPLMAFKACIFWLPKGEKTGTHDHQNAINRGRVISGCMEEVRYRVTRDRILPTRKIAAGSWFKSSFQTAPYAIHELVGAGEETAIALSLYFPGRDY